MTTSGTCYDCGCKSFKQKTESESVEVKGLEFESIHTYYICENCGEEYASFENPNENLEKDFQRYREIKGWYSPEKIRRNRKQYGLSLREYASLLGISYSTLSEIENGSLQNEQQNSAFILADSPHALKKLVENKKGIFKKEEKFDSLLQLLDKAIYDDTKELEKRFVILGNDLNAVR